MNIERLKKRYQYLQVAKSPIKVKTGNFIVQAVKTADLSCGFRFGITASKRVGSAVVRNLAKRRIRALIKNLAPSLLSKYPTGAADFVVIAFPTIGLASFSDLSKDFDNALSDCIRRIK